MLVRHHEGMPQAGRTAREAPGTKEGAAGGKAGTVATGGGQVETT